MLTETDALGKVRSEGTIIPAKEGTTLQVSIDADLQRHLARAIADTARAKSFIAGAGVIMDVRTGAVRALVSYPSYDANVMSSGGPASTIAPTIRIQAIHSWIMRYRASMRRVRS